jgi:hypothetical protein
VITFLDLNKASLFKGKLYLIFIKTNIIAIAPVAIYWGDSGASHLLWGKISGGRKNLAC